ncbi:probable cytochrome P450 6a14 [Bradysia coprophila]|uniref:probable cytochrome P450 6a14 n=1 Tax=Bradysia coprophila TaxID=38358 RepID=UPI00187DD750|nr:probable cytochrome P450 6a14 [Bradysia coprophila]
MAVGIFISLLFVAAASIYYWISSKYTYFERHGFLSKKPALPHGNLAEVGTKFHLSHVLKQFYEEFKNKAPAHGLYQFLMSPSFVVTDLDVIKDILIKDFDNFRNRGIYHTEDDVLSNHLFIIEDEPWKTMRQSLSPTFTSGKMKVMFHTVLDISNKLVEYMKQQDEVVEVKEVLAKFTTDVISNVAFGLESNSLNDPNSTFRKMGLKFFNFDRKRQIRAFIVLSFQTIARKLKVALTPKDVSDFFIATIRDTVDYRRKNKIERKDFLDLLLKVNNNGKSLTLNEMTAQSFVFWIAGFETSSSTATFCLYFLSIHQDIQEKLRTEIQTTLAKYDNQITYEGIMEMKYLQMVIDEALRLYGPVFNLMRKAENDYKIPNTNLVIPKGARVSIPVNAIHTDPEYYPEPEKFIPERFSEENKKDRHPMAHLPFGDGPRNCIGLRFGLMQTKISLIQLLTNFKFSPSSKTPIPMVLHPTSVVMSPRDDMHLKVEKL